MTGNIEPQKYTAEAREKWGNTEAYSEYTEKSRGYSKEQYASLAEEMNDIFTQFSDIMQNGEKPASDKAQSLVMKLQKHITDNYYTCTKDILAGLGQMYTLDERFKNNIDKNGGGTAEFVCNAIKVYCK